MSLANYNAVGFYNDVFAAYYSGTDALKQGYALCWDVLASITATDVKARLGNQVVKPSTTTTSNLPALAGIVAPASAGITGPGYIDIIPHQKNRFFYGWMHAKAVKFVSFIGLADADYGLILMPALIDSGANNDLARSKQVAISADDADTGATAALGLGIFK